MQKLCINMILKKLYTSLLLVFILSGGVNAQIVINEVSASNTSVLYDEDGDTPDWIELYNTSNEAVLLSDFYISDTKDDLIMFQLPEITLQPEDYTLLFASDKNRGAGSETGLQSQEIKYPHTNFKLSSDGETVYLSNVASAIMDSLEYPELQANESYGIYSVDNERYIFSLPTPGTVNNVEGYTARSQTPTTLTKGGFFNDQVTVSLQDPSIGDVTYFTEDGSIPTESDEIFGTGERVVNETKILRFKTFESGSIPSEVITETYFINEEHGLPVISLSTHPDNLWSDENGIYVIGTNGITGYCYYEAGGANWNQDWEIPVHLEFYEDNGSKAFGVGAGAKIAGGCTRKRPTKSLSIFFRGDYGTPSLDYKMFNSKETDSFEALVLRNSGNDSYLSMFRDGLMTILVHDTEIDLRAYRAAVLYLNGEYWGIHNIREKVNEHFIASNSNANPDNIDMIQGRSPIRGTIENYDKLISFVTSNDLEDPLLFAEVEDFIDMDNYIDYMATQIYYANTDWPGNNMKAWRSREADGAWRWILYDTDFGFGLARTGKYFHNTLNFALEDNGPNWPNPPWSTLLFRELVESELFRAKFANRMADLMNANFKPSRVIEVIDSLAGLIESEIPRHMTTSTRSGYFGGSVATWNNQIDTLKTFANNRPTYIENHLTQSISSGGNFEVGPLQDLTVTVSDPLHGRIKVNRLLIEQSTWTGHYFSDIDIPITAIPKAGYEFVQWTGDVESTNSTINVRAGDNIAATFAPSNSQNDVVINEIMYNTDEAQESDDWIELYNSGSTTANLAGWILKDEDDDHEFILPEGAVLEANGYVVLVKDLVQFQTVYPEIENIISEIGYGFSGNSDQVRLFNSEGHVVDSVHYDDEEPWPIEADGSGYSLELIDANTDNTLASSWRASTNYLGSPGIENGILSSTTEDSDDPKTIQLLQNYPNPFNPSTTISFSLPKASNVSLQVYSITGQLVATLLNEFVQNGDYSVRWDASAQASGIYFYTLHVDKSVSSKRMVLIK